MAPVGRPNPCCTCGAGTAWAVRQSLCLAGVGSHPPLASATGQSRPGAALHPALPAARRGSERRRHDGDGQRTRSRRPGCGLVEELLAASGASGWTADGSAAPPRPPVLGGGPAVTGVGAGRDGRAGPGGGRGPGPPGRRAAAGRDGRTGGGRGGRRPPSISRCLPSSATFSPFTAGVSPWSSPWTRPGAPSSPGSGDSQTATSAGGAAPALRRRVRVALCFPFRTHIRGLVPASDVNGWLMCSRGHLARWGHAADRATATPRWRPGAGGQV